MPTQDSLLFPSGRSVGNCRKDAKHLAKLHGIPLHEALDLVSRDNGLDLPWHKALSSVRTPGHGRLSATSSDNALPMTSEDVAAVMDAYPELTHFGMGVWTKGIRSCAEISAEIEKQRDSLRAAVDECNRACRYLAHIEKRKTLNRSTTSYGLKHRAEYFLGRFPEVNNRYVANGAFICAAIHLGFQVKRIRDGSPNVYLNYSSRSPAIEWARLESRHSAYLAQVDRARLSELEASFGIGDNI